MGPPDGDLAMKAVAKTIRAKGALEVIDREQPTPGPRDALVRVAYAGLCGSDAGIYKWKSAFERMELPCIIGHEYTGEVVATGPEVARVSAGDRVVERPIRSCGHCHQCQVTNECVCQQASITGVDHDGAFAGYLTVPERQLQTVPSGLPSRHAAIAEPVSIATRAVTVNSRVRPADEVLVAGPGPIGLFTAQIARAQGGHVTVAGVDRDASHRLPVAAALGFETVNVERDGLGEDDETGGFAVVFDTTGHPSGLTLAADAVRNGGQLVIVGQTGETSMAYSPLVRAEIDLQCSYGSVWEDVDRSLRLLAAGTVDPEPLLDDQFSLTSPATAFEAFLSGETVKPLFDASELRD